MKAIVLNGFGDSKNFSLGEIEKPAVKADEVLVRIRASAFNPIDYQMRLGLRESRLMTSPVLGREFSGVIVALGAQVQGFSLGEEVMAASGSRGSNGTYAQYIAIHYKMLAPKPAGISFEQAAAIPSSGLTALQAFKRMNVKVHDLVFIGGGSGAVGRFLIRLLKRSGVRTIFSTAGNEQSRNVLESSGLLKEQVLDYRESGLVQKLLELTGRPFDFVVDLAGGSMSETAAEVLKVNGTYVDITFLGTEKTREILFDHGDLILNISNYAYALEGKIESYGLALDEIRQMIESGWISPPEIHLIGGLSVSSVQKAHDLMENNQVRGKKIVMSI
jgi:NADPH:quinone reductase-like Zn-dependent oxidoreductase